MNGKWLLGVCGLAILAIAGYAWLNKNNNMITLTPTKAVFNNEPVTLTLVNQSEAAIYVKPTLYDGLSLVGKVEKREGEAYTLVNTHDQAAALTSTREYQAPEPLEVPAGGSAPVTLTGLPAGFYRVTVDYQTGLATSPDFEIK